MRMKGKKPIFSYKDTWSLDQVLGPLIAEGVKKFRGVIKDRDYGGYPATLNGPEEWDDILGKIIFAFENKEPDISNYNFSFDFIPCDDEPDKELGKAYTLRCTNDEERDRYDKDMKDHYEKVQEGLDLFSKMYHNLWW